MTVGVVEAGGKGSFPPKAWVLCLSWGARNTGVRGSLEKDGVPGRPLSGSMLLGT